MMNRFFGTGLEQLRRFIAKEPTPNYEELRKQLAEAEAERDELLCTVAGKIDDPMAKAINERISERFREFHRRIREVTDPLVETLEHQLADAVATRDEAEARAKGAEAEIGRVEDLRRVAWASRDTWKRVANENLAARDEALARVEEVEYDLSKVRGAYTVQRNRAHHWKARATQAEVALEEVRKRIERVKAARKAVREIAALWETADQSDGSLLAQDADEADRELENAVAHLLRVKLPACTALQSEKETEQDEESSLGMDADTAEWLRSQSEKE